MELIFCTHNPHKVEEVAQIFGTRYSFLSLKDIGFDNEIPEPFNTLELNAHVKANEVFAWCKKACFSEDTGLFVPALNGAPGVHTARYAGNTATSAENIQLLLSNLKHIADRDAYFKTVICYRHANETHYFEGICKGKIAEYIRGEKGFGYDPVFIPSESNLSFAELGDEKKNEISHRRKAMDAFLQHLDQSNLK
jgi:XTP/dITP diphosphohydrolase